MSIEWSDKYLIGDKAIDAEHRELFNIAARFQGADSNESQLAAVLELQAYTKMHFWHEENLMQEVGYPLAKTHERLHAELINKLAVVKEKIDRGNLAQTELEEFINFWFIQHMVNLDAPLVVFVKKHSANS